MYLIRRTELQELQYEDAGQFNLFYTIISR